MSGISGSFRVPTLIKRRKVCHGLATFDWTLLKNQQELGSGSFGSVHSATYGVEDKKVVVKKLKGEASDAKRRFLKEAEMLNGMKHINIPAFLGFSDNPHAIMMEYAAFDFGRFGVEKKVSSLEDFYHFVDCEFDFESFSDVLVACLKDIVTGLDYLHMQDIVHRDLKPSNILVSNQHYCDKDEASISKMYAQCPIICKVTDFGLSRSLDAQTQSVLQSRTEEICRGTPVYMAPEIHMGQLTNANQNDLKKMDVWSLGMLAYAIINPNLSNPYRKESEILGVAFNMETMKIFMQRRQLPSHDPKYEFLRVTQWWQIEEIFDSCARFEPDSRPVASEVLRKFNVDEPESSLIIKNLKVSQNTALERADSEFALQLQDGKVVVATPELVQQQTLRNDGTNSCAFLALGICDAFLQDIRQNDCLSWENLVGLAEEIITKFPVMINSHRDSAKMYEASEAKAILTSNELLVGKYDLSEECVSANGVFSEAGRKDLFNALTNQQLATSRVGLYTCSPYTFLIGRRNDSLFLIETHPIGEELGGNGNGILVATEATQSPPS